MSQCALTAERLRELMRYNPRTGVFTLWWRKDGKPVGSRHSGGYWQISIDGRKYMRHRLAWLYVTGEWPAVEIDHIDGDRTNDRIANLREATRGENSRNRARHSNNKSGFKGVARRDYGWDASIMKDGRQFYVGTFKTAEEAHAAYVDAAQKLHGVFARVA